MFRFLTKTLFVAAIWKRYKRTIITSIVLSISYFLISDIHDDYIGYVANTGDKENLLASYFIKWAMLALVTGVYFLYNNQLFFSRKPSGVKTVEKYKIKIEQHAEEAADDPFFAIREKATLKSKSDLLMKENPDNNI